MEPKPGHFKIFLFLKPDVRNLFLKLGVIILIYVGFF